jgi:hypothetical protein
VRELVKLAEALILRADYQKRFEALKQRLFRVAKVQDGDRPAENPTDLLREMESVAEALTRIIQQINATNSVTLLQDNMMIADAIAVRDVLRLRYGLYRDLAQAATVTQQRTTRSEVKFVSGVNVREIQQKADDLAREQRELDARIQEANWLRDLSEAR